MTLRGGKGVVVRWKRKDAIEIVDAAEEQQKKQQKHKNNYLLHPNHTTTHNHQHNHNHMHTYKPQPQIVPRIHSRAIRSTYTGKSIESKKKVIRMLFVLVMEFFVW